MQIILTRMFLRSLHGQIWIHLNDIEREVCVTGADPIYLWRVAVTDRAIVPEKDQNGRGFAGGLKGPLRNPIQVVKDQCALLTRSRNAQARRRANNRANDSQRAR